MAGGEPDDTALASSFASVARTIGSGPTVEDTLARIVTAAVTTISTCEHAGVFLLVDGEIKTMASSDPLVVDIDVLQLETGEGPCLDAVHSDLAYNGSADLANDASYPRFGPLAAAVGVRSALGLRLLTDHRLGALNLYSSLPDAFGIVERATAVILATHVSTALDASQARDRAQETNRSDLRTALASREVIGQAQGILMERERITAEQAFTVLRQASQDLNVKLREIAQRLVDTGENPRSRAHAHDPGQSEAIDQVTDG